MGGLCHDSCCPELGRHARRPGPSGRADQASQGNNARLIRSRTRHGKAGKPRGAPTALSCTTGNDSSRGRRETGCIAPRTHPKTRMASAASGAASRHQGWMPTKASAEDTGKVGPASSGVDRLHSGKDSDDRRFRASSCKASGPTRGIGWTAPTFKGSILPVNPCEVEWGNFFCRAPIPVTTRKSCRTPALSEFPSGSIAQWSQGIPQPMDEAH